MTLPLPPHFEPEKMSTLWVERVELLSAEAPKWAEMHAIKTASSDQRRVAAFAIDCQVSFCHPQGGLYVPGAVEDSQRVLRWAYKNLDKITGWVLSLDTHELHQIFHPAFWRSSEGQQPTPMTTIRAAEVRSGEWIPRIDPEDCVDYLDQLEASGKYVLTIWPYHGLLGGISHALLPAFTEAVCFHSLARDVAPWFTVKGQAPLTEMYSVLAPEVTQVGQQTLGEFDEALFSHLMSFDDVYVFGQASSHCVLATLDDLSRKVSELDPSGLEKFVILMDAMSPVPAPPLEPLPEALNFPLQAKQRLDALVQRGMRRAFTTDPMVV